MNFTFQAQFIVPVPGPLPLLGAAAGFSFTRRLHRRVKQSRGPDQVGVVRRFLA